MSFALYLEFAHSLQSFEFIKKKNFQDKKLISIVYFKKQSNKKKQTKKPQELVWKFVEKHMKTHRTIKSDFL